MEMNFTSRDTADEANAYFAQNALGNKDIMKHLVSEKPSLKERILDFFKGAVEDSRGVPVLDKQAKQYYRQYKKWFDDFSRARTYSTIGGKAVALSEDVRKSIDLSLLDFVNSVDKMQNKNAVSKRKYVIGEISETHAKLIKEVFLEELGKEIDLSGYSISISGSAVQHIEEKHGKSGTSDHSMADSEDVARVGWAVNNAENGHIARTQNGAIDYSTQYKNADGTLAPKVILEKEIEDGKIIIAECVPDSTSKKIHIVSARKIKSSNGQVLNVEEDSPQPTSKTLLDGIATTDSIPSPA